MQQNTSCRYVQVSLRWFLLIDFVKANLSRMKKSEPVATSLEPLPDASEPVPPNPEELPVAAEPAPLTPEALAELKILAGQAAENWDRLLRVTADFENFKKRAAREKQEAIKFANESLMQKLIPVLDTFEMALAATQNPSTAGLQSLQDGVVMIHAQLKNALAETGLEEVNAVGQVFDPNLHEAVSQQESADVAEGQVLQQLRKGYKLRDRLLRPATVIVAKQPAV